MSICMICGKESDSYLCDNCKSRVSVEQLCDYLINYNPEFIETGILNSDAVNLYCTYPFKDAIFSLSEELSFPRKELIQILCLAQRRDYLPKDSREWLYSTYEIIKDSSELSDDELNRVRGLVMSAFVAEYRYKDAEELAYLLIKYDQLPKWCYYTIGDFYTKTRRYDEAEDIITSALKLYKDDEFATTKLTNMLDDNNKRRLSGELGKKEYLPATKEAKEKYVEFMASLEIDVNLPSRKYPKPISIDDYPDTVITVDPGFDSFVAFDVETTGLSSKLDSIIEIGAIKVINGEVVEDSKFIFQEFIRPFRRKLTSKVSELTGIQYTDVKDAREMWEVIPDFMEFVGDLPLVGYNSVSFDSKFLARAGRYSQIKIQNPHFDVLRYARQFIDPLGLDPKCLKLTVVAEKLGIQNPCAHRALADAITTAKVFVELKKI